MAPTIVLSKNFDINNVTFSDLKMLDNGGKIVYVSYNRAPLIMQTPAMSAPFGMSVWDNDGKAVPKYTLDLSFKGMDASPGLQSFYAVLEQLDGRLVDDGFANQGSWFKGKKYGSREIVEALYTPMIKHAKDRETGERTDKYPPTFKAGVPFRDNGFTCDVFNDRKQAITDLAENLTQTKGAKVTAIVQCTGIWFAGGKFGVSWRVVQMKLVPNTTSLVGYAFRDDDDNDADAEGCSNAATNGDDSEAAMGDAAPGSGGAGDDAGDAGDASGEEDDDDLPAPPPVTKGSGGAKKRAAASSSKKAALP